MNRIRTYASLDVPDSRTVRNVQSLQDWFRDHKPVVLSESWFLGHNDDLICLSDGREYGWLDVVIEDTLNMVLPRRVMKV